MIERACSSAAQRLNDTFGRGAVAEEADVGDSGGGIIVPIDRLSVWPARLERTSTGHEA